MFPGFPARISDMRNRFSALSADAEFLLLQLPQFMFLTEFAIYQRCRIFASILGLVKDTMLLTEFIIYQDAEFLHPSLF